jgi:integrase
VPAYTVNRICGSGLEAINTAARWIETGDAQVIVAGGAENMTMMPYYLRDARYGYRLGHGQVEDGIQHLLGDPFSKAHMGITAENLAEKFGVSREEQDEVSARSQQRAVAALDDPAARCALIILRGTGLRLGELLDLELDCVIDYADHGTWLRVPLGKLNTERTVPLHQTTVDAFDDWVHHRGHSRPLTHPRTGRPVEFLWIINGRRMGAGRVRRGLQLAATHAGIGHVTPHQLRHTYATSLVNGGMSLQALMAVLGHVTPEMTLRYAHLASDTIRDAYTTAIAKTRPAPRLVAGPSGHFIPDRIEWLHSEMTKTRLAHGFCTRHLAAGPCPYANICEQCDNFIPDPDQRPVIAAQLADVITLRDDATTRNWPDETERHQRVADALTTHLHRIDRTTPRTPTA